MLRNNAFAEWLACGFLLAAGALFAISPAIGADDSQPAASAETLSIIDTHAHLIRSGRTKPGWAAAEALHG